MNNKELKSQYKQQAIRGGILAIKNNINGKILVAEAQNLQGAVNRFNFSKATNSCVYTYISDDWKKYGAESFTCEILETLEKKDTMSQKEFKEELEILKSLWLEKFDKDLLYRA